MTVVPVAMPVTIPVEEATIATLVLPLLHTPPPTELLNVVVLPAHTVVVPVIADGTELTVSATVLRHPPPVL